MLQCNPLKEEEQTEWFANQVGINEFELTLPILQQGLAYLFKLRGETRMKWLLRFLFVTDQIIRINMVF